MMQYLPLILTDVWCNIVVNFEPVTDALSSLFLVELYDATSFKSKTSWFLFETVKKCQNKNKSNDELYKVLMYK